MHKKYNDDVRTIYKFGHELERILGEEKAKIVYEKYLRYWVEK